MLLKKRLLLLVVYLLIHNFTLAQDLDFYKSALDTVSSQHTKLIVLDSVISKSRKVNTDDFLQYSLDYIQLAKELDSIEAAAKKAINISYTQVSVKNDPKSNLSILDDVLRFKEKVKDSFLLGNLYLKRGGANFRINLEQATRDYEKAIATFGEKDSIYKADAYLFNGQAYSNLGDFVPAGENYRKAYEYFEALGDYQYMNYAQQGITTMFSMNGFFDQAKEERENNIAKMKELDLHHHLVTIYYNQSLDFKKQGKKGRQLEYLNKALKEIENDSVNKVYLLDRIYVYSKLLEYYLLENNPAEAEIYYKKVMSVHDPKVQDLLYLSHFYEVQANHDYLQRNYNRALKYAQKKMQNAKQMRYEGDIIATHELLSRIYEAKGDYKNALIEAQTFGRLEDSLYNKTTANSLAYYQTLYETEKKENELQIKNASIQLLEKDNEATRKRLIFITTALLLLFGIVFLFRNRRQIQQKKILQERYSQELLASQEEERSRVSKDLHDGLGQQLLLIKNKLIENNDPKTKKLVEEVIEDVRSISRDLHPFQLQELGITKAIEMTLTQIDENTTLFISSEIENIDNLFDKKQEVNLYRIVQETFNNILKHAKAEASKVTLKRVKDGVHLEIRDNGVGFDFSEKYRNLNSLGLKTLLERTKFLNGQMKVTSKKNLGTTINYYFPTS